MLLNFSEYYPSQVKSMAGQPTCFITQIFVERKIHTLRDKANRFKPNCNLHICTGSRTKRYELHGVKGYKGSETVLIEKAQTEPAVSRIMIWHSSERQWITLDRRGVCQFIRNDGFFTEKAFVEWFFGRLATSPYFEVIKKEIIHFTDFRYATQAV